MNHPSGSNKNYQKDKENFLNENLCRVFLGRYFDTIALVKLGNKDFSKDARYSCELIEESFIYELTSLYGETLSLIGEYPSYTPLSADQLIISSNKNNFNGYKKYIFPLEEQFFLITLSNQDKKLSASSLELINLNFNTSFQNYNLSKKLNLLEQAKESEYENQSQSEKFSSSTVLLAEDNLANQILMTQQSELLGYSIDVAENGEEAYKLWKQGNYKIILTDCNMPVMDGFELTAKIREEEKKTGSHIPIVAVTANAMKGEAENCLNLGMDDYLPKPIRLKSMSKVLDRWLSQSETLIDSNTNEEGSTSNLLTTDVEKHDTSKEGLQTGMPLDCDLLTELLGEDQKIQRAFVNSFLISTPPILDAIETACNLQSVDNLGFSVHKIKSSTKAVGAVDMLKVVESIEQALPQGDWGILRNLSQQLADKFNLIENFVAEQQCQANDTKAIKEPSVNISSGIGLKVLLLDDDPFMLDYIKIILLNLGVVDIFLADEGASALEVLENEKFVMDVIFCDLNMPNMDGVTFLRLISQKNFSGSIVINSGEEQGLLNAVSELTEAHQLNLLGSLKKPIMPEQVDSLFAKLTNQNRHKEDVKAIKNIEDKDFSVDELANGIRDNQIVVYYQPKIEIISKKVVGFEALARWVNKKRGMVSPNVFIPIAESENLIGSLTDNVFVQAINQTQKWCQKRPEIKVSVNFSMQTLSRLELPDLLHNSISNINVNSNNIIIEVTESGLMQNLTINMEVLARLKLLGFRLSIDDFGTGYSSLNQLQRLPFSELKLDRSYVTAAHKDKKARAILESSVELAKKLSLSIVAEGVETQEDWDLVKELGCNTVQGYYIARPMPTGEATQWLDEWEKNSHPHL